MYIEELFLGDPILNIDLDKKCFSFTWRDAKILLFLYNTTCFFLYWVLLRDDFSISMSTAMIVSLFSLMIITVHDIFEDKNIQRVRERETEILVRKKLKDEYQRVYRNNKREELLKISKNEDKNNHISDVGNPCENFSFNSIETKRVHFSYLEHD